MAKGGQGGGKAKAGGKGQAGGGKAKAGSGKPKTGGGKAEGVRVVAKNRAATRRWTVEDSFEAGLVLVGTEVKAIREGKVQLGDAYAIPKHGEVVLLNLHIGPYGAAGPFAQHEPTRPRKLLIERDRIERLVGQLERKGYSLIPLDVHFRGAWAKVQLGLCSAKKVTDRREDIKKREADLEARRAMRRGGR